MSETPPDQQLERDAEELDERLAKLDEHIDEAKGKADDARPGDRDMDDNGPAEEQSPPQFDRDQEQGI